MVSTQYFEVSKEAIKGIIAQTRNESECITFTLHKDTKSNALLKYFKTL